ncbi:hypothetical protein DRP05_00465 [Archaeoglobales archaeon]|nr:MAG: hypothetical protein DRP05_00465 [Archaeoglobales archaeon]
MKRFIVDKKNNTLIVKKDSIVDKHIRFNGKIVAGMYTNFWGNVEADEVYLGKNCFVGGSIKCKKVVVGAYTKFNSIDAEEVVVLGRCKGSYIKGHNVRIREGSVIGAVEAENFLIIEGSSKLKKMSAKKIIASKP